jgi:phospholipase/carboxylesterase
MPPRKGLRVVQSHGRQDPLLPFSMAERLRDLLLANGLEVQWIPFNGGHGIPPAAIEGIEGLLSTALQP